MSSAFANSIKRAHVVISCFLTNQCTETTAVAQVLPVTAKTMIYARDKGYKSHERRHLIEDNGALHAYGLVQVEPAAMLPSGILS